MIPSNSDFAMIPLKVFILPYTPALSSACNNHSGSLVTIPNPPLGFGSNASERMRCKAEGAFSQQVYRDVHEQINVPTTKQIPAMNIAPESTPIAESGAICFFVFINTVPGQKLLITVFASPFTRLPAFVFSLSVGQRFKFMSILSFSHL